MNPPIENGLPALDTCRPYLEKLKGVFKDMDRAYRTAAAGSGFECRGCADNCCLTRFYHHTLLEFMVIYQGLQTLAPTTRDAVVRQAAHVCRAYREADQTDGRIRIMCPLNRHDRCLLYDHRPMICRMHGIPHRLRHPVQGVLNGPGCHMFVDRSREKASAPFDRTPFYTAVALLEKELRQQTKTTQKIRLTIADMILRIHGKTLS